MSKLSQRRGIPAKAFLMLAFAGALLLAACNSDGLVNPDLEGKATFTILDAYTNLPVEGVNVAIVGGPNQKTSAAGLATLDGIRAGSYIVQLSKKGFEASLAALTVQTSGTEQVVAINVVQTYQMHRLSPGIKGRILVRPSSTSDTTSVAGADSVLVELRFTAGTSTQFQNPVRRVRTSSKGFFTFDSIPEVSDYVLVVPQFSRAGRTFVLEGASVGAGLLSGAQQYTVPNILLTPEAPGALQVFARSSNLVANQPWVFEFSSSVDTAKSATNIVLRANATTVAATRTWSSNFTVLSIRPATGTWTSGATYSVVLSNLRDTQLRAMPNTTLSSKPAP